MSVSIESDSLNREGAAVVEQRKSLTRTRSYDEILIEKVKKNNITSSE